MTAGDGGRPTLEKTIFLVSDSTGQTAKLLLSRLLVQYGDLGEPRVRLFAGVTTAAQLTDLMEQAEALSRDLLVFATLVDPKLSDLLEQLAASMDVRYINVFKPLLTSLDSWFGSSARGIPGDCFEGPVMTQSAVNTEFFRMADAVQFVQQHISGLNRQDWPKADVILVGLSRVGKEVAAGYLAQRGVRAACLSVAPGEALPPELSLLRQGKIVVLAMEADALVRRRRSRIAELERRAAPSFLESGYANPERVEFEVKFLADLVRRHPEWLGPIDCTYLAMDELCAALTRELRLNG
uniref:Pyruvate, phosphate dikinase regulatory protein n=1 Tax=Zooxanthella nutricula TaxID=1333877 RepID=A0A7S2LTI3_9DINO